MKKSLPFALRAILLIVLATFSLQVWGADCSSTDIELTTQVDVDNFQSTYGGGGVCDTVSGRLWFRDSADITNLNGLSSLTSVGGNLIISRNFALTNLDGLSSLTSVGGYLSISNNIYLTNLDGLSSLTSVGGYLRIGCLYNDCGNAALTDLNGLSSLTSIGGSLVIGGNAVLTNLDGLSSLTSLGWDGDLDIEGNASLTNIDGLSSLNSTGGSLKIYDNAALTNLVGLSSLTSLGGSLSLWGNAALTNLNGLSSLTSLGGSLSLRGNAALTNIDGLSSLTSLDGNLIIRENPALANIGGLSSLTSTVRFLQIDDNAALTNIDGLSALTSLGGSLSIASNPALTNIDSLSRVVSVGGYVSIWENPALANIDGLSSLTSVVWGLGIYRNASLTNLDGLSSLTSLGWDGDGDLNIQQNASLSNIDGLSSLTSVDGDLNILWNDSLTNLDGLSSLTSVEAYLEIHENASLTNLDGLSNLTSIGEFFSIDGNDALTNLDGLSSLTSTGGGLSINDNDALTNLDGLSSLTSTGRGLGIYDNDALTNLNGLSNLTSVGSLYIGNNTALTNIDGLSNITRTGILEIRGNNALTNLNGLFNVTSVGGELDITSNHALTNINGLSNITSVNGYYMQIADNTALTNLSGLSNLTSVGGGLFIWSNPYLTSLDGLSRLTSIREDFYIEGNRALSRCTAVALLLGWPDGPPNDNVGGHISVGSNKPGCNSVQEILDSSIGLTAPNVTTSIISSGQVTLTFTPAYSFDTSWPITGYQAQCLAYDQRNFVNNTITDIPDESSVVSPLAVSGVATNNAAGLSIPVNITHPDNSQLSLTLMSPNGTVVKLWHGTVGDGADLVGAFPSTLTPVESLEIMDGEDFNGEWQLTVEDGLVTQTGTLNFWGITVQDKVIATSETSPVTITGLANNQIYSCAVSAMSGQGIGPASNTVSANFTVNPFTIGGHVSGLSGTGLVLRNNFDDDLEISADGSFTFATALYDGSTYSVTVLTQPTGSDQTCSITNGNGILSGADIVDVTVTCFKPNNELRNIATRAEVRTGNEILIGGFVILGNEPKCVIVQGLGQSVAVPVGVTRLADPVLQLKSGLTTIAENDNWQVQDNPADVQAIDDSGRAPDDILEAAIYKCLDPGAYTALVTGFNNSTGVGMVAIYDADDGSSYLKNIATRSWVGTDHAISIAGFVVTGDTPKQILIRGLGPSMESKFPPNSPLLLDPQLRLYQGDTLIETNDDWGDAANAAEIGALPEPLPPTDAREPAILMILEPGLYTAHLLGVDGTTGIGNVAVYDLTGRQ